MESKSLMDTLILDLEYLYEISDKDPGYIHEVLRLFMESVPDTLNDLEQSVKKGTDFEAMVKQSHFLKSSSYIVKVKNMYDNVTQIELLAKKSTGLAEIRVLLQEVITNFNLALPLIKAEQKRTEQ